MWLGNGCVLLACMAAVAATPVTTSEDPIAQLVETVQSLVASETGNSPGMPVSRGSPELQLVLDELKDLNRNLKKGLTALSCSPPFFVLGEDCYNIILEDMTWEGARNACLHMGADLAQPSNVKELKEYVALRYPRKGRRNFWIGGIYSEKVWQWLSGDLIDDSHWHDKEPSGNGACLAMYDGWENPFSDFPCENERRAICKRL